MFDALVRPILTYGSDVWGLNKTGLRELDKVFFNYLRRTLHVKATTSNAIVYGECGRYPPSVSCHINVLCYLYRLLTMQDGSLVKSVFNALNVLRGQGFSNWVTKAFELAKTCNIDIDNSMILTAKQFKDFCSTNLKSIFITKWYAELHEKPLLRTYRLYKNEFRTEHYLDGIISSKYRIAVSKIRASSHDLEIERGRYTRPRTDPEQRLCISCNVIENEEHFVTSCEINADERQSLFHKITSKEPSFRTLDNLEKFIFLVSSNDNQVITWFGKFLYKSFSIRSHKIYRPRLR